MGNSRLNRLPPLKARLSQKTSLSLRLLPQQPPAFSGASRIRPDPRPSALLPFQSAGILSRAEGEAGVGDHSRKAGKRERQRKRRPGLSSYRLPMLKALEPRHLQTLSAELPAQCMSHNRGNPWGGVGGTPWRRRDVLGLLLHSSGCASPKPTGMFWTLS